MRQFLPLISICLFFVPAMHGCSYLLNPDSADQRSKELNAQPALKKTKHETIKPFDEETLYQLLVADIALIRGQYTTALSKYMSQAKYTRDEAITAMAFGIAQHAQDGEASLDMAAFWLDINPLNN